MGIFDNENDGNAPLFGSDDDVNRIASDTTLSKQTRDLARQVQGMEGRVRNAGLDPKLTEPRASFFGELLDTLDAPRQGVAGVLDALARGDMFGKDASGQDVGTGWRRGQEENTTTSDILGHLGMAPGIARGTLGFAGDVISDPLSWITFGAGGAAKAGGKVLAEEGLNLSKTLSERLLNSGVTDIVAHDAAKDDIFKAIYRYQDQAKLADTTTSPAAKLLAADNMKKAKSVFSPYLTEEEIAGKQIAEPNKLRIGLNLPFVGHLTGETAQATEELAHDIGPIGQSLREQFGRGVNKGLKVAGDILKPGHVDLAQLEFGDDTIKAINNVKDYANETLGKIGEAIDGIPVLGAFSDRATKTVQAANDLFKQTFMRKTRIGEAANNNTLDFFNAQAANKMKAVEMVQKILKPEELTNKALQKDVIFDIDSMAMEAARQTLPEESGALDAINRIKQSGEVADSDATALSSTMRERGTEPVFRSQLDEYLKNPNIPPERKDAVQRVIGGMDELAKTEAEKGLNYQLVDYYIPHRYKNLAKAEGVGAPGATANFEKKRTFANLGEAFAQRGLVADDELPELLRSRFQKGFDNISTRQYAQRLMVEEGLNPKLLSNLYKEAISDPKGDAAKALARYRVTLEPLDAKMMTSGRAAQEYQEAFAKRGIDPEAARIVDEGYAKYEQKLHEELQASGFKPLDNMMPRPGEMGEKVVHQGEKLILPKPIADAMKEATAGRDIVKDALSGSSFGKALLGTMDYANSWFKTMVTLPWPGYWGQNFLGDRFNQAMQGIHASSPGVVGRTRSVLAGESALTNKNGIRLTKDALERVIKEMGMEFSVGDVVGTLNSFNDTNVAKHMLKQEGFLKNAISADPKRLGAALGIAQDSMQRKFDSFFRVNHFVHRFEAGDTVADAIRASQEAYYNYRDMSPVESSLFRRFYMFYGYMSKATKQSITNLVTAPGNLTMQLHGTNALADLFMDPEGAPTLEKHEMKLLNSQVNAEQLGRVVGRAPDGTPITARGFAAPINAVMQQASIQMPRSFSIGEFFSTFVDSGARTLQKQFAASNPVINAVAQGVSGKNLYFDKPLDSEFLRKLPDLTEAAEAIAGFAHTDIPTTINDTAKKFLGAVPDGKGRLIVNPTQMWILTNLIPGMGRAVSTGGALANTDIPTKQSALRTLTGINVSEQEPSRTYLYDRKNELEKFISANSVNQRLKNQQEEE